MKKDYSLIRTCLALQAASLLSVATAYGQNTTYVGPENGDFMDPENWGGQLLPVDGGGWLVTSAAPSHYNLTVSTPNLRQFQAGRGATRGVTVRPGGRIRATDQLVVGIVSGGVGTLNVNGGEIDATRIRMSVHGGQTNPGGSVMNVNDGSVTLANDLLIGENASAFFNLNGGAVTSGSISLRLGEININGTAGSLSTSGAFNFGFLSRPVSLNYTVDDDGNVSAISAASLALAGTRTLSVSGSDDGIESVDAELLLIGLTTGTFTAGQLANLQSALTLKSADGVLELRNNDSELWFNGTVMLPTTDWQFAFADLDAPVNLDFGQAKDTVENLLRLRPQDLSLEENSVRVRPTVSVLRPSTALASLADYIKGQNFVIETEMTLQELAAPGPDQVGLVVLGGPHEPVVNPFTSSGSDTFYTLSFNLGEGQGDPGSLRIREGYTGLILGEANWEGRPVFGAAGVAFSDDFEDAAAAAQSWTSGGQNNIWEVGPPTTGPGAAYTGVNVFATGLDDTFQQNTEAWLRSPVIDLTGADGAVLTYADYHNLDNAANWHWARVSVLDAVTEEEIEVLSQTTSTTANWRRQEFSLSPASIEKGAVIVEFRLKTDSALEVAGWYIDDVEMSTTTASPQPLIYTFRAEGTFDAEGSLILDFTLSEENGVQQSLSASIEHPFNGKFFGFGALSRIQGEDTPSFDFNYLSIELGETPAITTIFDQTIFSNSSTGPLSFMIHDEESDPSSLTVTATSSNNDLVPLENIVLEGAGIERTVTVTPVADASGSTTITLTVSGGAESASTEFVVDVVEPLPSISDIFNRTININTSTGPIPFTVGHQTLEAGSLVAFGFSSNKELVPDETITIEGSGADRTITVTPAADLKGEATITVVVDDGARTATTRFVLTVRLAPAVVVEINPTDPPSSEFQLGRVWHWDIDGDQEGWTVGENGHLELVLGAPINGFISGTSNDSDPQWISPEDLNIPVTEHMIIEFRIRRDREDSSRLDLFWADVNGAFAGIRRTTIPADDLPRDGQFHVVRIHYTNTIVGELRRLRFDPMADVIGTSFDLDYVRIYTDGDLDIVPSLPTLSIQRVGDNAIRLSWVADAGEWTLQSSSEVGGDYTDADLEVTTDDGINTVDDSIAAPRQFYRLVR